MHCASSPRQLDLTLARCAIRTSRASQKPRQLHLKLFTSASSLSPFLTPPRPRLIHAPEPVATVPLAPKTNHVVVLISPLFKPQLSASSSGFAPCEPKPCQLHLELCSSASSLPLLSRRRDLVSSMSQSPLLPFRSRDLAPKTSHVVMLICPLFKP